MLDVRMLTKRWYKLWSFQKDFFKKKKGKKKLYTEKKKICFNFLCFISDYSVGDDCVWFWKVTCWVGVLVENVYFTWNICVLSILTLAIHPQRDPVTPKKEVCACMHVWSGVIWGVNGQWGLFCTELTT